MSLKKVLLSNKYIRRTVTHVLRFFRKYPIFWGRDILNEYAVKAQGISFIQIGSNDGVSGDPLHGYVVANGWKGILVEPVPYLYDNLKKNYSSIPGLIFENSAVSATSGKLKFYRLQKTDKPGMPSWYEQLGSFRKDIVMNHRKVIPYFDELFIEDEVNAITFEELLKKHNFNNVKLLHIDTEGYDYEILKLIPFQTIRPDLVMFEHKHLKYPDYKRAIMLLTGQGYIVKAKSNSDTIAIRPDVLKQLGK